MLLRKILVQQFLQRRELFLILCGLRCVGHAVPINNDVRGDLVGVAGNAAFVVCVQTAIEIIFPCGVSPVILLIPGLVLNNHLIDRRVGKVEPAHRIGVL